MATIRQLKCGTEVIPYRILRKLNKHLYLTIKEGIVEVRANQYVSEVQIEAFIHAKRNWIIHKLTEINTQQPLSFSHAYVWGIRYSIFLEDVESGIFSNSRIILPKHIMPQRSLIIFYRQQTQLYLEKELPRFSEEMQLFPSKVSVKHTTSQWGSCSVKNALSFSLLAAQLPSSVMNYLIVHELAHIRHKHHQSSFWALVSQIFPDHHSARHQLRQFECLVHKLK